MEGHLMARAGLTPARLAVAAAELADEIGFDQVTAAEVARRFGVKTASLYSHVAGTTALRESVSLLALAELADRAEATVLGRTRRDALAGLADAFRDYAREHPGRFAATTVPLDAETARASAGPRHARLIAAVLHGYGLDPTVHVHATRLLGSTIRGFITLEAGGSFDHSAPAPDESWGAIIDALDTLLSDWPTTRRERA